jgi:CubicO group peptidase (beta-lactamase class C family)
MSERFSELLAEAQQTGRAPTITAAVLASDGGIAWEGSVGEGATPRHRYAIASITKTFTAAAVMQLRDRGLVDLDEPVTSYLPGVRLARTTLRSLLSHRSGLGREVDVHAWENLTFVAGADLLERVGEQQRILPYEKRWKYSNLAYMLLGEVVGRVTATPFKEHLARALLEPLGLGETSFRPDGDLAQPYFVHPWTGELVPEPVLVDEPGLAAPGGLWSTAADLCRWGYFLARPREDILAAESVAEMAIPRGMADLEQWRLGWGLGLMLSRTRNGILVGHSGGLPGFSSGFVVSRREAVGAAVLVSANGVVDAVDLATRLTEAALAEAPRPAARLEAAPPPDDVRPLLGHWYAANQHIVLQWRDGRLEADGAAWFEGEPPTTFERVSAEIFRAVNGTEPGELLSVVRDAAGMPVKLYWPYPFLREPRPHGPG